jgi:hypothetical protein
LVVEAIWMSGSVYSAEFEQGLLVGVDRPVDPQCWIVRKNLAGVAVYLTSEGHFDSDKRVALVGSHEGMSALAVKYHGAQTLPWNEAA